MPEAIPVLVAIAAMAAIAVMAALVGVLGWIMVSAGRSDAVAPPSPPPSPTPDPGGPCRRLDLDADAAEPAHEGGSGQTGADRTPEWAAEPGRGAPHRIPERTPIARGRIPKAPRRALYWYEQIDPRLTWDRVVGLPFDEDGEALEGPPLSERWDIEMHARVLLKALAAPGNRVMLDDPPIANKSVERGLFAVQVEQMYYAMCVEEWWRPYRWGGTNGVAQHLRQLLYGARGGPRRDGSLPYKYLIRADGTIGRQEFYPLPKRTLAFGPRLAKPTPKRTPKLVKPAPGARKRSALGDVPSVRPAASAVRGAAAAMGRAA
jgi:hypothetical protein